MEKKKIIKEIIYDAPKGLYTIIIDKEAFAPKGDTYAERFKNAILNFLNVSKENKFNPIDAEHIK
jgi:hypothetical protein